MCSTTDCGAVDTVHLCARDQTHRNLTNHHIHTNLQYHNTTGSFSPPFNVRVCSSRPVPFLTELCKMGRFGFYQPFVPNGTCVALLQKPIT